MKEKTLQFENEIQSLNTRLEEKSKASKCKKRPFACVCCLLLLLLVLVGYLLICYFTT